ncbi:hypothetical protein DPMN_038524 [Dreissena polymorpha]|uniref:Uncharacterized protein n=1 Tax=Dreissena polymorpha TaxID=45954 RepID=A0A9D4MH88_DREPO|nr:hypothetical protein DPMN_038524 [Dreissena polymorpha]
MDLLWCASSEPQDLTAHSRSPVRSYPVHYKVTKGFVVLFRGKSKYAGMHMS